MIRTLAVTLLVLAVGSRARADIIVDVFASVAPNGNGSPSFDGYAANAITGISAGGTATGNPGLPTYYSSVANGGTIFLGDIISTDFSYWRGTVNPSGAFAGELGNRIHFGLNVRSTSGQFTLSNVRFTVTDTFDGTLNTDGDLLGFDYSPTRVGVINNASGPPTLITSGSGLQPVDALWLVGVGVGYEVLASDLGGTPTQAGLAALFIDQPPMQVTGTYIVKVNEVEFTGQATVNVDPQLGPTPPAVPAPPAAILAVVGFAAVGVRRWRMKSAS